jgi:hypothetical protein
MSGGKPPLPDSQNINNIRRKTVTLRESQKGHKKGAKRALFAPPMV